MDLAQAGRINQQLIDILKGSDISCPICTDRLEESTNVCCLECGHLMHTNCLMGYIGSEQGQLAYDQCPGDNQFPCPVCRGCSKISIANGMIDRATSVESGFSLINMLKRHYPSDSEVRRQRAEADRKMKQRMIFSGKKISKKNKKSSAGLDAVIEATERDAASSDTRTPQQRAADAAERRRSLASSVVNSGGKSPIKPTYRKLKKSRRNTLKKRPIKTLKKRPRKTSRKTLKKRSKK